MPPAYGPGTAPQDANATRGRHFKRLMRKPVTISLGLTAVIAAFVAGALVLGAAIGGAAGGGVALLVIAIVFWIADSKAAKEFFKAYADARGLILSEDRGHLPPVTPLLTKGDDRYTKRSMSGALPGGLDGTLALYTYEVETTDSKGNRQTSYYHFTVVMADVPDTVKFIPRLHCQRRSGFRFLEGAEDAFRTNKRIELESEKLDDRYEIFVGKDQDENWCRQLFSPTFIVWLADKTPEKFAFELESGVICVNCTGHKDNTRELDGMCEAAAAVVTRLREEARE